MACLSQHGRKQRANRHTGCAQVRVVWHGELSNYADVCELYITPTELTVTHDCARLMLTLYLEVRRLC